MTFVSQAQIEADKIKARRQAEQSAPVIEVGDTVRVGRGQKLWIVESFWENNGSSLAQLAQVDGYSHTSVHVCSLTLVTKAEVRHGE